MDKIIKIGIVGAGKFGGYHARKCADHPETELIGIHDLNAESRDRLAQQFAVRAFENQHDLLEDCDAVVIAAPASQHGRIARAGLAYGCHLLIEKPIATALDEALDIVQISQAKNLIVQVGHQERFVARAIGLDKIAERPRLIRAHRLNPFSVRGTDTSVTMDLMTHDIDLANWLMGGVPTHVQGRTITRKSDHPDHVWAHLSYPDGDVFLEASRLALQGDRRFEIHYPSGTIEINFNAKTLTHDTPFQMNADFGQHPDAKDSLAAGTEEFIRAIKTNSIPLISAQDGLNAAEIALKVDGHL
ncbi:MAG: Gfo/Idh/MocA family oxidoreductase [Hellea sp.]|nr:Gfo/Idh/MocA family oxidoreductase [Hellea sp.]